MLQIHRKQILKYLLITTEGRLFDKLVDNLQYHSLTDLLVELMQMNVGYFPVNDQKDLSSDDDKPEPAMTEDQLEMKTVLD